MTTARLQELWQRHKSQLGREAGQDDSLLKMSSAYRDATLAHFRAYAAVTLEELACETGTPEEHLTPTVLQAFGKLRHKMVCFYLYIQHANMSRVAVALPAFGHASLW